MAFVDPVRLCKPCSEITKVEAEFFTKHIKVLFEGAPFHVKSVKSPATTPESPASITNFSELMGDEIPKLYFCKLTSDQKFLIFYDHDDNEDAKNGSAMDPLEVAKIIEIQPNTDDRSFSINLRVKINTSEEMTLQLDSPPEPSRKPSVLWLSALRKGLSMVLESKETVESD